MGPAMSVMPPKATDVFGHRETTLRAKNRCAKHPAIVFDIRHRPAARLSCAMALSAPASAEFPSGLSVQ